MPYVTQCYNGFPLLSFLPVILGPQKVTVHLKWYTTIPCTWGTARILRHRRTLNLDLDYQSNWALWTAVVHSTSDKIYLQKHILITPVAIPSFSCKRPHGIHGNCSVPAHSRALISDGITAWSCCSKRWGSRKYFLYASEPHQGGLLADTCSPTRHWIQPPGFGVQRGGQSVCTEDFVVACVAGSSPGLICDFLPEQEAKLLLAQFCRPNEFRWRLAQVFKFSDFLQKFELPLTDSAAATTNESYRCKSKMWFR